MSYNKIAFIFPGQGAQYPGMAKDFFENFGEAKAVFEEADDILHKSLSQLILNWPLDELTETKNSQTGIFVASCAILRVLEKMYKELVPHVTAGLSLGEYTALHTSRRLSFDKCLELVQKRGNYMNDACESTKGVMAVILGLDSEAVECIVKESNLPGDLFAANFNCPGQTVISGSERGIEKATELAKAKGAKRVLPLQVHGAFHSGFMQSAEDRLKDHILAAPISSSSIDFVMNVPGDFVTEGEIKNHLIKQVTHSVRWEQGVQKMVKSGVDLFVEIGCGKTLAGFNKRICPDVQTVSIEKLTDLDTLEKLIGNK